MPAGLEKKSGKGTRGFKRDVLGVAFCPSANRDGKGTAKGEAIRNGGENFLGWIAKRTEWGGKRGHLFKQTFRLQLTQLMAGGSRVPRWKRTPGQRLLCGGGGGGTQPIEGRRGGS